MLGDADFFLAFGDLQLGNAGFLDEVDQFLELSEVHLFLPTKMARGSRSIRPRRGI
jgi:hypothetical protein